MGPLPVVEFAYMVGIDLLFIAVLIMLMLPLGIYRQAAFAVMKRNFIGYFSNPTGYVFLCLFVLLTSFAAFWPHEFFTTNLANFDQLNQFLPYIMLVFIPAITMSIWSEERRQGTDELLLTLPAQDFDIVIGKYFAAVMVFTVSLVFSQLSNYAVLIAMTGGSLDSGLLFSTYLGYWFVGIAMLSIGMVASFLTNNLTVGFIFGVMFNAPLAFLSNADVIVANNVWISRLYEWSLLQRFDPFGRGLISLPSVFYFLGIVIVGIYLSLVLIGRRHWMGGRDGTSLLGHFVLRSAFLVIIVIAGVLVVQYSPANRIRLDVSMEKISTLTPNTRELLDELSVELAGDDQPPIVVDAYVGSNIPTDFVQTKYDLVNLLREFDVMGGNRVRVNVHTGVEPFSVEAIIAEKRFGIRPIRYVTESRGAMREEEVILGAAFSSGLDRVVIPFFPYGTPVEYELIRSINTVAQTERTTIGVVKTDAFITGEVINTGTQQVPIPKMRIVHELEKQYDVQDVELNEPLSIWLDETDNQTKKLKYSALVVVQPSKMSPVELDHLIQAIREGQPTVIFEDPVPILESSRRVPGTPNPRAVPRGGTNEACEITKLWSALGLVMSGRKNAGGVFIPDLVWKKYNPYRRDRELDQPELIILDNENESEPQISGEHPATAGLDELYFPAASVFSVRPDIDASMHVEPLVMAQSSGIIPLDRLMSAQSDEQLNEFREGIIQTQDLILAAHITTAKDWKNPEPGDMNCIYISDLDILSDEMVARRDSPVRAGIEYRFQDTSFVQNVIDFVAGQLSYIDIRNRRERYVTLRVVEDTIKEATEQLDEQTANFEKQFETEFNRAATAARNEIESLDNQVKRMQADRQAGKEIDETELEAKQNLLEQVARSEQEKLRRIQEELSNNRNEQLRTIRLDADRRIQEIQRQYKLAAVLIPPIPPLLLGLFVFTRRRLREREGISKARRLK